MSLRNTRSATARMSGRDSTWPHRTICDRYQSAWLRHGKLASWRWKMWKSGRLNERPITSAGTLRKRGIARMRAASGRLAGSSSQAQASMMAFTSAMRVLGLRCAQASVVPSTFSGIESQICRLDAAMRPMPRVADCWFHGSPTQ